MQSQAPGSGARGPRGRAALPAGWIPVGSRGTQARDGVWAPKESKAERGVGEREGGQGRGGERCKAWERQRQREMEPQREMRPEGTEMGSGGRDGARPA